MTHEQIRRRADEIAQGAGYRRATAIILGQRDRVLRRREPGYYKRTTGEKVAKAYRARFGWKNTDYLHALVVVEVAVEMG